jgi:hypothetical protein
MRIPALAIGSVLLLLGLWPLIGSDPVAYIVREWPVVAAIGTAASFLFLVFLKVRRRNREAAYIGEAIVRSKKRGWLWTWTCLLAALVATIVFDLSGVEFGALAGLAVFVGCAIDDAMSGVDGLYLLLVAAALVAAIVVLANFHQQSMAEIARSFPRLPYFASAVSACGLGLMIRSLLTRRWRINEESE